ncbi:glycosyltransferase family A protein [Planktotalea arctica]
MHEQTQLAKLRRAVIARLAHFGAAPLLPRNSLNKAEHAALALKTHLTSAKGNPITTFAIPLVGAHQVSDWAVIEETLERSLRALIAQSDPNWRAVICSQTRPDAITLDPRITHLPFDQNIDGHDKVAKLQSLARHCLTDTAKPGFFMPLDGDDLLHRDFTIDLHAQPDKGLLVCAGYMVNAGTGHVAETQNRSLRALGQKPFWKFCGSCMALPVGGAPAAETAFFQALAEHEHRLYPYLAELAGFTLERSTAARALYVINHGENFESRRGRGGFKQRFIERFTVTDHEQLSQLTIDFPGSSALVSPRKADL